MEAKVWNDLFISILQCLIYLIATQILLNMNIKKLMYKTVLFGFILGIFSTVTFQLLELVQIRLLLNIFSALLLIKVIFNISWWNATKNLIIFSFFAFFSQSISFLVILYGFGLGIDQTMNEHNSLIFLVYLPFDLLNIILALFLRKIKNNFVLDFFSNIDFYRSSALLNSVTFAILLQSALLMSLLLDYNRYITYSEDPLRVSLITLTNILVILISIYVLFKTVLKTEEKIVEASSAAMSENIYSLINAVRSQRHDFVNHIQVINSLFHNKDKDSLADYLNQLTNEITILNNVLKVNNPLVGALLNSKITKANIMGIDLQVDFNANLSKLSIKAFDLTRIIGNLIDNAIEAIELNQVTEKWLKVNIYEKGPFLCISVTNPGSPSTDTIEKLFQPGYTTKGDEHSGLGLHICTQLARKLHGKINHNVIPGKETSFSLMIPK